MSPRRVRSELEAGGGRHHRGPPVVDRDDDLGAIDPLQVDRSDTEVATAELALDHVERNALARHLNRVGMAELVRSEPAPNPSLQSKAPQLRPHRPAARINAEADARTRTGDPFITREKRALF